MPKRHGRETQKADKSELDAQIIFRCDKDDRDALEEAAKRDSRDLSSLMRKLVKDHLEQEKYAVAK